MEIEILAKETGLNFKEGDLFQYTPDGTFGILQKSNPVLSRKYEIKFANGQTIGIEGEIRDIEKDVEDYIRNGKLLHFSQDNYKLQLVRK